MGLLSLKCPSCGANLNVKEGRDDYFCQYCGAKLEYAKQRIELSGTVNVSGMANEATLLERAFLYAEDSNFNDAKVYFNKVLDINPRNAKAYMGLLICKLGIRTIDDLQNYDYPISQHEEYQKAVRFAGLKVSFCLFFSRFRCRYSLLSFFINNLTILYRKNHCLSHINIFHQTIHKST